MVWYVTREAVKHSLEINATARADRIIDPKIEKSSRDVEEQLHRRFYPELATRRFDWPNNSYSSSMRLWLGDNEIISATSITSGGVVIPSSDYFLRRGDDKDEPPYSYVELNLAESSAFGGGTTYQRSVVIAGLYGYKDERAVGGTVSANINSSATALDVLPSSNVLSVGVGSLLLVDDERMIVTNRSYMDTTQNTLNALVANKSDQVVNVANGALFAVDETILVESEKMRIVDIAGNNLLVIRAWDGSTLAAHTSAQDIYGVRRFTVQRGVLGTTAAEHSTLDTVNVQQYPGPVVELALAETVVALEQNASLYARTVGSQDNEREASGRGLQDVRASAYQSCGRKLRKGAI